MQVLFIFILEEFESRPQANFYVKNFFIEEIVRFFPNVLPEYINLENIVVLGSRSVKK